jgi:hypothetical protein
MSTLPTMYVSHISYEQIFTITHNNGFGDPPCVASLKEFYAFILVTKERI